MIRRLRRRLAAVFTALTALVLAAALAASWLAARSQHEQRVQHSLETAAAEVRAMLAQGSVSDARLSQLEQQLYGAVDVRDGGRPLHFSGVVYTGEARTALLSAARTAFEDAPQTDAPRSVRGPGGQRYLACAVRVQTGAGVCEALLLADVRDHSGSLARLGLLHLGIWLAGAAGLFAVFAPARHKGKGYLRNRHNGGSVRRNDRRAYYGVYLRRLCKAGESRFHYLTYFVHFFAPFINAASTSASVVSATQRTVKLSDREKTQQALLRHPCFLPAYCAAMHTACATGSAAAPLVEKFRRRHSAKLFSLIALPMPEPPCVKSTSPSTVPLHRTYLPHGTKRSFSSGKQYSFTPKKAHFPEIATTKLTLRRNGNSRKNANTSSVVHTIIL